jgi:hypothetical protein
MAEPPGAKETAKNHIDTRMYMSMLTKVRLECFKNDLFVPLQKTFWLLSSYLKSKLKCLGSAYGAFTIKYIYIRKKFCPSIGSCVCNC